MEQTPITLKALYAELKKLEAALQKKNILSKDDWQKIGVFADEELLAQAWLSPEDEEAWKDL